MCYVTHVPSYMVTLCFQAPVKPVRRQPRTEVKAFCERITSEEYKCQVSSQLEVGRLSAIHFPNSFAMLPLNFILGKKLKS